MLAEAAMRATSAGSAASATFFFFQSRHRRTFNEQCYSYSQDVLGVFFHTAIMRI